jgi:hypothetical protein
VYLIDSRRAEAGNDPGAPLDGGGGGGKALLEGDTVGRTAEEKLPVRYVPSPVDPKQKVWRVELK